jgi:hypothetical protein
VVFIQLFGGNDGINMVYPLDDGFADQRMLYEQYRPTLKLPNVAGGSLNDPLSMASFEDLGVVPPGTGPLTLGMDEKGNENALHPAMHSLWDLYQNQNNVAVIHGVHYPHPNHSHFRSEEIWYTGDPIGTGGLGWFGRYLNVSGFTPTEVPAVIIDNSINPLFKPSDASIFSARRVWRRLTRCRSITCPVTRPPERSTTPGASRRCCSRTATTAATTSSYIAHRSIRATTRR